MRTFKEYTKRLNEAGPPPGLGGGGGIGAPGALPPGGVPPGGGMPPPPMGGMGGPPPPMGGMGGPPMGGDMGGQQQPPKSLPLNPVDVWDALEKVLGVDDDGQKNKPPESHKHPDTKHLHT